MLLMDCLPSIPKTIKVVLLGKMYNKLEDTKKIQSNIEIFN